MKRYWLIGIIIILVSAVLIFNFIKNAFDKEEFVDVYNKFSNEGKVQLFCYWGEKDFRINNAFYSEYEIGGIQRTGFHNDSYGEISDEEVFSSSNLDYLKIKELGIALDKINASCIEKDKDFTKFISSGFIGSEKGIVYSPNGSPLKLFDKIESLGEGWYRYWLY